ncbi:CatB-related O-acetyltransferase [Pseudothauera lacus]|uniref:Acetyltransferase n=1 Tax=Pseudothauera lacus TaxID=2136175 RepID=A0A2T4IHW0_9RHOO|nr:CatB-related O-acetyltransferase [Pseudothauera lacus]PTD97358.1 hypothetical protein C8261_04965 [Pseudothauera lacus]
MRLTEDVCAQILQATDGVRLGSGLSISGRGRFASPCMIYGGGGVMTDVSLGGYSYLVPPFEASHLSIGNYCSIAGGFRVGLGHPVNLLTASPVAWRPWMEGCDFPGRTSYDYLSTRIGSDVWIGTNVIVKAGVSIGDGCFIGAGSVVTRDLPPFSVAAGNPCRVIRSRFNPELLQRILLARWFDHDWRDEQLDWRSPEATLDGIEAALVSGYSRPFVSYYYEIVGDGLQLYREEVSASGSQ